MSVVTVFPPASCTVTLGWVAKFVDFSHSPTGWVVNANWAAGPTETVMVLLVAGA